MTTQIALRLQDELVAELDSLVSEGQAQSRAEIVTTALRRELRRLAAERDATILRTVGPEDDLDELVAWSSHHHIPMD